jgi:phosphoenolpyruvate carboxykinase (ATP)
MESEVEATFSTCFGAPFLPLPATTYSRMLSEKLREHGTRCYLINTGWSGGPYGVGSRIDLAATRQMVQAVINGKLDGAETRTDPFFGLNVPVEVPASRPSYSTRARPGTTKTPTTSSQGARAPLYRELQEVRGPGRRRGKEGGADGFLVVGFGR